MNRDHHVEVAEALYSLPGALVGAHVDVRADSQLVRIRHRGQVVKVHPRMPAGRRATDPDDLPTRPSSPSTARWRHDHRRPRRRPPRSPGSSACMTS